MARRDARRRQRLSRNVALMVPQCVDRIADNVAALPVAQQYSHLEGILFGLQVRISGETLYRDVDTAIHQQIMASTGAMLHYWLGVKLGLRDEHVEFERIPVAQRLLLRWLRHMERTAPQAVAQFARDEVSHYAAQRLCRDYRRV